MASIFSSVATLEIGRIGRTARRATKSQVWQALNRERPRCNYQW